MSPERGTTWTELRGLSGLNKNGDRSGEERSCIHRGVKGSGMEKYEVCTFVVVQQSWRREAEDVDRKWHLG